MSTRPLVITAGEPAGIGPECLVRVTAAGSEEDALGPLVAVADPLLLERTARRLDLPLTVHPWRPGEPLPEAGLACLPVALGKRERVGEPDPANAAYVLRCLREAVDAVRARHCHALVTGPLHKGVINDAGIPFSGHTEYLAKLANRDRVVMLLVAGKLRVGLVTTHLPLREVPDAITGEAVEETIRITHGELRARFGLEQPRLQVLGLNPHAGEGGHLGHEDDEIIRPAIDRCRRDGLQLSGPVPADTAFTPRALSDCDAVLAMYHDQGLPVLKHAGFGTAVNTTLGLPFIRTSVDHGTALDIAALGQADPSSLAAAARLARRLVATEG